MLILFHKVYGGKEVNFRFAHNKKQIWLPEKFPQGCFSKNVKFVILSIYFFLVTLLSVCWLVYFHLFVSDICSLNAVSIVILAIPCRVLDRKSLLCNFQSTIPGSGQEKSESNDQNCKRGFQLQFNQFLAIHGM